MNAPGALIHPSRLAASELRWQCPRESLNFATTAEITPVEDIVGQATAVDALRFGLEIDAPGQNVYVRGLRGTGRLSLVRRMLEQTKPTTRPAPDRCYVHNFCAPDCPKLLVLPRGQGTSFRDKIREYGHFIAHELAGALDSELLQQRRGDLERANIERIDGLTDPLQAELAQSDLALVMAKAGPVTHPAVLPIIDGHPVPPEQLLELHGAGKVTDEQLEAWGEKISAAKTKVENVFEEVGRRQRQHANQLRKLIEEQARELLEAGATEIRRDYATDGVSEFLDSIIDDVVQRRLADLSEADDFLFLYQVNLIAAHDPDDPAPVVVEYVPSVRTLIGSIDVNLDPEAKPRASHMSVFAGSLLRADGGVLVMEAAEVVSQPGAWAALIRTLRCGRIDWVPPEVALPWLTPPLKPEPIEINVKIVLLGEAGLFYILDRFDPDFPNLFKVLADFDNTIPRTHERIGQYIGVIAKIIREDKLRPFSADGIGRLLEHAARIAATREKLTARFGRIADIAREASYLAVASKVDVVEAQQVSEAIVRTKRRADGPARRFREMVSVGEIRILTSGATVGQINGLAVINAGPLTYGFPTRITATIGPGNRGAINIERESNLSGAIHSKGFYILGGLLRRLLPCDHPLVFDASIAFEQCYGGIDGDSASAAEICCLLSALTGLPIAQNLAMTGAIDQMGNILSVGAVNEKIEGFYDTCREHAMPGDQGVVIPITTTGDLALRRDVVAACEHGEFSVFAVDTIYEAISLIFGRDAGEYGPNGYPADSVLGVAMERAHSLWAQSTRTNKPAD